MPDQNLCLLMGRLTRDPEVKTTGGGTTVAELGLAINEKRKQGNDWVEKTTFCDVSVFGRQAEFLGDKARKGDPVHVSGRLELDTWDDRQTGQKRSKLKVVADRVQLLTSRAEGDRSSDSRSQPRDQRRAEPSQSTGGGGPSYDDDIPFLPEKSVL